MISDSWLLRWLDGSMCRWLAYSGAPLALNELVFNTEYSLIDQSLAARSSVQTTNGDGFGVGWYSGADTPAVYKHTQPAWNDPNLRDICTHTRSSLFIAHVRAATATAIQQTNCHPFRYGRWLLVHNGLVRGYEDLRRDLTHALDDHYFRCLRGTTDSELMFLLALQFGLQDDVEGGVARMVGFIEACAAKRCVEHPVQMTLGISDGDALYAVRYSSERNSRSLFYSETVATLRRLVPPHRQQRYDLYSDDTRMIVSEPLDDLPGAWQEVPESSFLTVVNGDVECRDFMPDPP